MPGLAELFFAPGGAGSTGVGVMTVPFGSATGGGADTTGISGGSNKSDKSNLLNKSDTNAASTEVGHPSLPSIEAVSIAAKKAINDCPPFVAISLRDSAPQLRIEDPPPVASDEGGAFNDDNKINLQRKMVVRGGMKGYRMSRATHGVTRGCYYYEAVAMGPPSNEESDNTTRKGSKRSLQEEMNSAEDKKSENEKENNETRLINQSNTTASPPADNESAPKKQKTSNDSSSTITNGHLRIGWSTRNGDLQAPVGYDKHSYGIRDISGSRVHNSRREDKWGGIGFVPGDVIGFAIFLDGPTTPPVESVSSASSSGESNDNEIQNQTIDNTPLSDATTNHILFFKNGELMGSIDDKAFDNITPGTYYPAISCYMDGAAQLNFGPHFVYPPKGLPTEMKLHPISDLCPPPPLPDDAVDIVISGSKEGKKIFFSKRTDETIVAAFKKLVKTEALVRHDAYLRHLNLHLKEIRALRGKRGLATFDLVDGVNQTADGAL